MIRLFIENTEIELTEDVQIALTKQFENLSNPTNIINDWSKTVSIPFTTKNNQTFGHIYNIDRVIVTGGYPINTYFNPLKKLNFRLEWNSAILMTGYAKLNEIKQNNSKGTYEITLFGQLGKVFQDIKKITFDTSTTEQGYLIDGSEYVDDYINSELVAYSWQSPGQNRSIVKKKNESGYSIYDIIGFAPNNSYSEGFDYSSFQPDPNSSKKFTDVLGDSFTEDTGVSPDTAIPNGMLPREIGEYRSYLQLPFIYWNKLFQIFQNKAESITGYSFDLDDTWFNDSNPYWFNLVYMLKPFDIKKGDTKDNSYQTYSLIDMWRTDLGNYNSQRSFNTNVRTVNYQNEPIWVSSNRFNLKEDADYTIFKMNYVLDLETSSAKRTSLKSNNALLVHVTFTGQNGNTKVKKYLFTDNLSNTYAGTDDYMYIKLDTARSSDDNDILRAAFSSFQSLSRSEMGTYADLSITYRWYANSYPYSSSTSVSEIHITVANQGVSAVVMYNSFRSNGEFTLNDLWNNDYNLFEEILKYCKMYRISISVDELEKKIIFKPYNKFFENYTVEDWTNKIDMSKDYTIAPVTLENKYVLFNYEDNKTKMGEEYRGKFGVNYGEYRLITEYNFNSETNKLFDKIHTSIVNTDNVLSWTNIHDNHKIIYSFPAEIYVYNKDKDKKQTDTFGQYFFHNGLRNFSTEPSLYLRPVSITDDTAFQQANNTYMYTQDCDGLGEWVSTYPNLDIVRGDNMCLFNIPSENYTYNNNYSGKHSIYSNLWRGYIDERYNIQNKKITCYVDIKPTEYQQFDWNKLVKVGNQLCIVNKIYDYNITSSSPTKVDLITIQDISGYTTNDYTYDWIYARPNQLTIPYDYYKTTTVYSSGPWQIKADDWSDYLTVYPTSGEGGEEDIIIGSIDPDGGYTLTLELLDDSETEVLAETRIECAVGGSSTVHVNQWYNEVSVGNSIDVLITSPWDNWVILGSTNPNNIQYTISPVSGTSGMNIPVTFRSISGTGVVDVYIRNDANDIVSFRVNVTA